MTASNQPENLRSFTGRVIGGHYELTRWIGGGAFGGVFESRQHILGEPVRRVACKLSRRDGMTEASAGELFTDVLTLARVMDGMIDGEARRHLVHVYDGGIAQDVGGRAFLIMEYVPGDTLADQFASLRPIPANLMLTWARQACTALRGLHSLDPPLVHRDIKPDNVLLGTDRTVRLIDFGLAARLRDSGWAPDVAGTLQYMAPETSQGASVPASDLYSLGVLVYEGLTGRHPFADLVPPPTWPSAEHGTWLYAQKRRLMLAPPSRFNNTVKPEVDELVLHCLRFDPDRRFRNASELLDALDALRDGRPLSNVKPGAAKLREAKALIAAGDLVEAHRILERALREEPALTLAEKFHLLRLHSEVLHTQGDPSAAGDCLAEGWRLVKEHAVLTTTAERVAVLNRLIELYREAKRWFAARRYEWECDRELGRG
ncbi:protein kinase domain-containing protein [Streptomyces mayteni]